MEAMKEEIEEQKAANSVMEKIILWAFNIFEIYLLF